MRTSIALCVLSMSSWTLAAPIVLMVKHATPKYSGAQITSSDIWTIRQSNFKVPGDASAQDVLEGRPDNKPYTPSGDVTPSEALAAPRPLKTSYLLSLKPVVPPADASVKNPREDQESVSQSQSQPEFQQSTTVKEETGTVTKHLPSTVELETQGNAPYQHKTPCHGYLVRQYVDMPVVSVVFLLITIIALIELWDSICAFTSRLWYGEGRIRLEDEVDEKDHLRIRHSDFTLQPAPKTRSRSSTTSSGESDNAL
ncbi:hypothetical protein BKA67DRAFT_580565 [Truncatella angustata]|uniref:Uncharacterized protein n=1 Tax=Truncatella angustata TaxID=152316 RepID=A0A9P8RJ38_9PEZI|nr:uncharacterized protein BKA67DRAFT_580565 [Truncatella angustata]KAH6646784.1 hypothetical protein BKA67DRAFT_580565 [Truncatella angustata]